MIYPKLNKQLYYFICAGVLAVLTDCFFYIFTFEIFGPNISKLVGFYAGVAVSFVINGRYTFAQKNEDFITSRFLVKYTLALTFSMLLNVGINFFCLNYFDFLATNLIVAFFIATFFSMSFNFLAMKFWIFR